MQAEAGRGEPLESGELDRCGEWMQSQAQPRGLRLGKSTGFSPSRYEIATWSLISLGWTDNLPVFFMGREF